MSGYKHATVTISQEEYNRLQEADMKKKFREYVNLKSQDSGRERELQNMLQQMEVRQRQLEEALISLGQDSALFDEQAVQEILLQSSMCYESLASAMQEATADVYGSLAQVTDRFTEEMQRDREYYHQQLHSLVAHQDHYQQEQCAKEEAAQMWMSRCMVMADFIQAQFDHERFSPGNLARILRNLDLAERNLIDGFFESSIQSAQQNYLELSDLHYELEQSVFQWQAEFDKTCLAVQDLIRDLEANASIKALGLQGEELPNLVDLNYWSDGKYQQLLKHCHKFFAYIVRDQQSHLIDDLVRIYGQIVPAIRESFESIIYEARIRALNSHLRMNIAEKALHALEVHGYRLGDAGYVDCDMRSTFRAQLDSQDGSEVTIKVLPADPSAGDLTNELIVITNHPYLKTEHEARLQWAELSRTLSEIDLKVSRAEVGETPASLVPSNAGSTREKDKKLIPSERQQYVR